MSILNRLPDYVVAGIRMTPEQRAFDRQNAGLRDDLIAIPEAEANGWIVSFRDDTWHNSASFEKDGITIWNIRGWRRAGIVDGMYSVPEVFPSTLEGLRAAFASTSPLVGRQTFPSRGLSGDQV